MNARFYEPSTGRFISQDSYSGNAYDPWTQHLYSYCGNNPTNFVDPTGHFRVGGYYDTNDPEYTDTDGPSIPVMEGPIGGPSSGSGGSSGGSETPSPAPTPTQTPYEEGILYRVPATGSSTLIPAQELKCNEDMGIYFYMVTEYYGGQKVLTPVICAIVANITTMYRGGGYVGSNGAYVSTFKIMGIEINNESQKFSQNRSTTYFDDNFRPCNYYTGCGVREQATAKAEVNYKVPYGETADISFSWFARLDTNTDQMGFPYCTGGNTLNESFGPYF